MDYRPRRSRSGSSLLEYLLVIPAVVAVGVAAVDTGNLVRGYLAVREGTNDTIRCATSTDPECYTGEAPVGPTPLYRWYQTAPETIAVPQLADITATMAFIRGPRYEFPIIGRSLASASYTYIMPVWSAEPQFSRVTGNVTVTVQTRSLPYVSGTDATNPQFYFSSSATTQTVSPVASVSDGTILENGGVRCLRIFVPSIDIGEGVARRRSGRCFKSEDFGTPGALHAPQFSSVCDATDTTIPVMLHFSGNVNSNTEGAEVEIYFAPDASRDNSPNCSSTTGGGTSVPGAIPLGGRIIDAPSPGRSRTGWHGFVPRGIPPGGFNPGLRTPGQSYPELSSYPNLALHVRDNDPTKTKRAAVFFILRRRDGTANPGITWSNSSVNVYLPFFRERPVTERCSEPQAINAPLSSCILENTAGTLRAEVPELTRQAPPPTLPLTQPLSVNPPPRNQWRNLFTPEPGFTRDHYAMVQTGSVSQGSGAFPCPPNNGITSSATVVTNSPEAKQLCPLGDVTAPQSPTGAIIRYDDLAARNLISSESWVTTTRQLPSLFTSPTSCVDTTSPPLTRPYHGFNNAEVAGPPKVVPNSAGAIIFTGATTSPAVALGQSQFSCEGFREEVASFDAHDEPWDSPPIFGYANGLSSLLNGPHHAVRQDDAGCRAEFESAVRSATAAVAASRGVPFSADTYLVTSQRIVETAPVGSPIPSSCTQTTTVPDPSRGFSRTMVADNVPAGVVPTGCSATTCQAEFVGFNAPPSTDPTNDHLAPLDCEAAIARGRAAFEALFVRNAPEFTTTCERSERGVSVRFSTAVPTILLGRVTGREFTVSYGAERLTEQQLLRR